MPAFIYTALQKNGQKRSGEIEAKTRTQAFEQLDSLHLQPLSLEVKKNPSLNSSSESKIEQNQDLSSSEGNTLKSNQIILFTEELSDLLEAGLHLEGALQTMEKRDELSNFKKVISTLRYSIREGSSLASALRSASPSFDELYCNLVAAGESSGSLPQILSWQVRHLNLIDELRSKTLQALIYPAFILSAGFGLLIVFMTVLAPTLIQLFSDIGKTMPLPTKILIAINNFTMQYGWILLISFILFIVAFSIYIRTSEGGKWWHETQLKLPLVGNILLMRFYTELTQTLSTLIKSGVPLLSAVELIRGVSANLSLKARLQMVEDALADGGGFSSALRRTKGFPSTLIDMVSVGEQTGNLGNALEKTSRRYDKELNRKIQRMITLIQPLVLIFLALLVGCVAYAIISGIFESMTILKRT